MSAITFVVEGVAHNVGGINWEVTPEAFPIDGQWMFMFTVVIGVATTIWFFIGGIIDIKKLYQRLRTMERDHADVGLVKSRPAPGGD